MSGEQVQAANGRMRFRIPPELQYSKLAVFSRLRRADRACAPASRVRAKPAMRGHFKTGHVRWPGMPSSYLAFA